MKQPRNHQAAGQGYEKTLVQPVDLTFEMKPSRYLPLVRLQYREEWQEQIETRSTTWIRLNDKFPVWRFPMSDFTIQQLTDRLQKLWVQATASCGSATPQLVEEIRELERLLKEMEEHKEATS